MKVLPIAPGDIIECDAGDRYEVIEIGPRNKYEKIPGVELLGQGILCKDLNMPSTKVYVLDIDVLLVNGESIFQEE